MLIRVLCFVAFASLLLPACMIASEQSPRGTVVRLATATPAPAAATATPAQVVIVTPTTAAATAAPTAASAPPLAAPATPSSQAGETYVVQPGDTLFGLSRRTGVPVAEIARASGIPADSQLRIGQQLRIPAAPAPSGSSIRITSPEAGATVRSPIVVQGVAAVFEGVVSLEVLGADGAELARASTIASQPDAGQPGPFRAEIAVPASTSERRVTLRVFWRSPRDGTPMDEIRLPLTLVG
jgi:LysM repeat protein